MSAPLHLLGDWDEVERRLRRASRVALFTDFDGTLAPIRRSPGQVRLSAGIRKLLASIAAGPAIVGVVSGRSLADVEARVGLRGIWYVGSHGYAVRRPGGPPVVLLARRRAALMKQVRQRLAAEMQGLQDILLEPKEATVAIHYRRASRRNAALALAGVRQLLKQHPGLRLLRGKKVIELLPDARTTKWTAIQSILKRQKARRNRPTLLFYLGDDVTDERVFERMSGISIAVGRKRTAARYSLASLAEVRQFLERFSAALKSIG